MALFIMYLIKLSLSLCVVWVFYQLVLRRLTFYNSNRWYLLGYTALSFLIPFINIAPILEKTEMGSNEIVNLIPSLNHYTADIETSTQCPVPVWYSQFDKWELLTMAVLAGATVFLLRFIMRLMSFLKLKRAARLVYDKKVRLYEVSDTIIPFSFGKSVFINSNLHAEGELEEIIRHEFVHIKQKHTIDIIWSEILCITSWYNPFAWLLRHSIRQNLEFIADSKALEQGIEKKQYQYLLLKVIGNNHFSIAQKFNFSSLKKRIAMMNKLKSARVNLVKFLFILPMLAVMLLAFRGRWQPRDQGEEKTIRLAGLVVDAHSHSPLAGARIYCSNNDLSTVTDSRGYYLLKIPYENHALQFSLDVSREGYAPIHQQENWGNFEEEETRKLYGNSFEFFGLGTQGDGSDGFSALSGRSLTSAELNYEKATSHLREVLERLTQPGVPFNDTIPEKSVPNEKGYFIEVHGWNEDAIIIVKDSQNKLVEKIDYRKWKDNEEMYEAKYGELPPPPPPPLPPDPPMPPKPIELPKNVSKLDVKDKKAVVHLKDGTIEKYDLNDPEDKAKFQTKYGDIIPPPPPPPVPPTPVRPEKRGSSTLQGFLDRNPDVKNLGWVYNNTRENKPVILHVIKKNGSVEDYHLDVEQELKTAVEKYGEIPNPSEGNEVPVTQQAINRSRVASVTAITDKKISLRMKDGRVETYDLSDRKQNMEFSSKYGTDGERNGRTTAVSVRHVEGSGGNTLTAAGPRNFLDDLLPDVAQQGVITGKEGVLVVITRYTSREQLTDFIGKVKEKGVELKFENIDYQDGKLVSLSGTMKSGGAHSNFEANDFSQLVLSMVKEDGKTYFKVAVTENKKIII